MSEEQPQSTQNGLGPISIPDTTPNNQNQDQTAAASNASHDPCAATCSSDSQHPETAKGKKVKRATWSNKVEFLLSAVSYAVGLGNVWRFPYLCYVNGGGAFLFPYLIMLAFAGLPLFFLELAFGQYASLGPLTIWRVAPIFKGIGYTMLFTTLIIATYYSVILGLTIFYFLASFTTELPWAKCGHEWNTDNCVEKRHHGGYYIVNTTSMPPNSTVNTTLLPEDKGHHSNNSILMPWAVNVSSPAEEYWRYHVLGMPKDNAVEVNFGHIGEVQWRMALCLLIAWVVVYLCIAKGIQTSGKVVYFTATFPYVVLTVLLIRGVTLEGAGEGIKFYLTPDFSKMAHAQVWKDAAVQIFYSLGIGFGTLLTLGSYNKFNNNCHRDALTVALINCGTSVFAGFVIFSVLGFMAHASNVPVKDVVEKGPGLAFIAYPEALAMLPGAPFWSILFFFMLITLGLGSMFPSQECVMTGITDEFTSLRKYKSLCSLVLCCILFLLGLPSCTQGGMYVVELLDTFTTSFPLLFVAFSECVILSWVYGFKRFSSDIKQMVGFSPNYYWLACWVAITPIIILFVLVSSCVEYDGLEYNGYVYPPWAQFVGWLLVIISLSMIPIWAFVRFWQHVETCHNFCWLLRSPTAMKTMNVLDLIRPAENWGPALEENKQIQVQYHKEQDMVNILDVTQVDDVPDDVPDDVTTDRSRATGDESQSLKTVSNTGNKQPPSSNAQNDENQTLKGATYSINMKHTHLGGESYM